MDIGNIGPIVLAFIGLLLALTVHEAAHAWAASRLGDPTARLQGRLSLNPLVHIDPIGTVMLPLLAFAMNAPIIGWAKPVPVDGRYLKNFRRDFMWIALAGPASNVLLAILASLMLRTLPLMPVSVGAIAVVEPLLQFAFAVLQDQHPAGRVQHDPGAAPRRQQRGGRAAAAAAWRTSGITSGSTASSSCTASCSRASSAP